MDDLNKKLVKEELDKKKKEGAVRAGVLLKGSTTGD